MTCPPSAPISVTCRRYPMTSGSKPLKRKKRFRTEASTNQTQRDPQSLPQTLSYVTIVVREYDEAIAFFTQSLGFDLIEDTPSKDREGRDKRWVPVAPPKLRWHENPFGKGVQRRRGDPHRQSNR